jgi:hypothetical protein
MKARPLSCNIKLKRLLLVDGSVKTHCSLWQVQAHVASCQVMAAAFQNFYKYDCKINEEFGK